MATVSHNTKALMLVYMKCCIHYNTRTYAWILTSQKMILKELSQTHWSQGFCRFHLARFGPLFWQTRLKMRMKDTVKHAYIILCSW